LHLERWAALFRFAPTTLETLYGSALFDGEVWLEPGRKERALRDVEVWDD
jgi:hypothetical protein